MLDTMEDVQYVPLLQLSPPSHKLSLFLSHSVLPSCLSSPCLFLMCVFFPPLWLHISHPREGTQPWPGRDRQPLTSSLCFVHPSTGACMNPPPGVLSLGWWGGRGVRCGAARRGLGCKRLGSQTPLQPRVSAPSGPLQGCPRGTRRPVSGSHTLISHSRCSFFFYFFFQSVLLLHFPSFLSFPVSSVSLSLSLSLYLCPAFPTV